MWAVVRVVNPTKSFRRLPPHMLTVPTLPTHLVAPIIFIALSMFFATLMVMASRSTAYGPAHGQHMAIA